MHVYYDRTHMRANSEKIRKLNISWCGNGLEHTINSTWSRVILDRTLSYSTHIAKVKAMTVARNTVLKKLPNSKWGESPATIRTTSLGLRYSTSEYACTVWERSAHTRKVNLVLNDACRSRTGCIHPSNIDYVCLLVGITPGYN